jgi:hypothetical protein
MVKESYELNEKPFSIPGNLEFGIPEHMLNGKKKLKN